MVQTARNGSRTTEWLASLPAGTTIATFRSRVDALGAAARIRLDNYEVPVWVASGQPASDAIQSARQRRPALRRLLDALGDDETFVQGVLEQASDGMTVLLVGKAAAGALDALLAGADTVIEFGRWTTRPTR
jgi:hypothetical protein